MHCTHVLSIGIEFKPVCSLCMYLDFKVNIYRLLLSVYVVVSDVIHYVERDKVLAAVQLTPR